MEPNETSVIRVQTFIDAPVEKVWKYWINPEDIVQWNNASDDWYTPRATNDLREGGSFNYRMEARDGSFGFDFSGIYERVVANKKIKYTLGDGRKVRVIFCDEDGKTKLVEEFEPETENSLEMQQEGWQTILNNFKKHVEKN